MYIFYATIVLDTLTVQCFISHFKNNWITHLGRELQYDKYNIANYIEAHSFHNFQFLASLFFYRIPFSSEKPPKIYSRPILQQVTQIKLQYLFQLFPKDCFLSMPNFLVCRCCQVFELISSFGCSEISSLDFRSSRLNIIFRNDIYPTILGKKYCK